MNNLTEIAPDQEFGTVAEMAKSIYLHNSVSTTVWAGDLLVDAFLWMSLQEGFIAHQSVLSWTVLLNALDLDSIEIYHQLPMQIPETFILPAHWAFWVWISLQRLLNTWGAKSSNLATDAFLGLK